MKRREFIRSVGLGAAAIASTGVNACAQQKPPAKGVKIQAYNEIGKTGLKMSDIGMGCGGEFTPYVLDHAIAVGVNYFDTAPDYGDGASEIGLGRVFKDKAKREKCILVTKLCAKGQYGVHLDVNTPTAKVIEAVEGSLKRLNTEYIDILQVHAIGERENDLPRLIDAQMLAGIQKLKEQGKVRHLGVSSHGPHCMEDCLRAAVDSGHFAMFMPAFNFIKFKNLGDVLKKAKEKGVGVVAMKTLAGAKQEDLSRFKTKDTSLAEAAFKWVFSHPEVSGLVITMKTVEDIDTYAAASGKRLTPQDQGLLDRYSEEIWATYCRTGCGDCLASCPHGVAIADILRYDMYYTAYGEQGKALRGYHRLPQPAKAAACEQCDGPCLHGCRYGLAVRERVLDASARLTLV